MRAYLGAAAHLTLAQRVPGGGARVVAHGHVPMPAAWRDGSMDLSGMDMPGISSAAAKPNLGYVYRASGIRRLHGSSKPRDVPPLWEVGAAEEVCAGSRAPLPPVGSGGGGGGGGGGGAGGGAEGGGCSSSLLDHVTSDASAYTAHAPRHALARVLTALVTAACGAHVLPRTVAAELWARAVCSLDAADASQQALTAHCALHTRTG